MCVLSELWHDSSGITLPDVITTTSCLALEEEKHLFLSTFTVHDSVIVRVQVCVCAIPLLTVMCVCACVFAWLSYVKYEWLIIWQGLTICSANKCAHDSCFTVLVQFVCIYSLGLIRCLYCMTKWPRLFSSKSFSRLVPVVLNRTRQTVYFSKGDLSCHDSIMIKRQHFCVNGFSVNNKAMLNWLLQ